MSYEELTLSGFIKEIEEVSSGPRPRKFCFVLGAGASKSSGIKSGQELVNIWEKDLLGRNKEKHLKWKEQLGINDVNKYEFYSKYYERRFKQVRDGYNYLEKLMESAKPNIGYVILSYILVNTKHNVVITTNFDHLIEDAINYYENTIPLVIGHESLAHYIMEQSDRPKIIKIHRDLLLDPKNRTSELDILHNNWKEALKVIFSEYCPIFIGYAGNDHSLMDYLIQNIGIFSNEKGTIPYWMIYENDKMSEMVSNFLNKTNGYLIEHDGFDKVLYLLGAAFGYRLPSKEDFISDAENRYKVLSDFIDGSTEMLLAGKEINGEANEALEVNQAIQRITSQAELQNLFGEAVALVDAGKYQEAIEIFNDLIAKNPHNARYFAWLGNVLHKQGCYEKAREELQRALQLEPDNARYHNSLGVTLHELGRYKEALEEKQRAQELEPDNARYHNSLGVTLHELGRYKEALEEKQRAQELEPDNAEYHNSLGETLHVLGCYEEALDQARRALELKPDNALYHANVSIDLRELGRYEEALKEMQKALELKPNEPLFLKGIDMLKKYLR